jgi:hypothetical protein
MQLKNKRHAVVTFFIAGISTLLFSFSSLMGGDMFEIYVNNNLVVQQHIAETKTVKNLAWNEGNKISEIKIRYSHCGVAGKNRSIVIKNSQNQVLKKWQFSDSPDQSMNFKIKDLSALQNSNTALYIYYTSKELPDGMLLATINN